MLAKIGQYTFNGEYERFFLPPSLQETATHSWRFIASRMSDFPPNATSNIPFAFCWHFCHCPEGQVNLKRDRYPEADFGIFW